jgi:hypothetical protein
MSGPDRLYVDLEVRVSHPPLTIRKHVNEILAMLHSPTGRWDGSAD